MWMGKHLPMDLDDTGAVENGPVDVASTWTAGSAEVTILGRYTGASSMIPSQPWNMEVVQGGLVGAPLGEHLHLTTRQW